MHGKERVFPADTVTITEKPEWVSWEEIKQCLLDAHAVNRAKGINMTHYQWPVEKIREYIGPNGVILVALDGSKVVGTAAISEKEGKAWYAKGRYAYMCFVSVLPQYSGQGIYGKLAQLCEKIAKEQDYHVWVLDTHEKNKNMQRIVKANGYHLVGYFRTMNKDHFNVVMAKWPDGCPNSKCYCKLRFCYAWLRTHMRVLMQTK